MLGATVSLTSVEICVSSWTRSLADCVRANFTMTSPATAWRPSIRIVRPPWPCEDSLGPNVTVAALSATRVVNNFKRVSNGVVVMVNFSCGCASGEPYTVQKAPNCATLPGLSVPLSATSKQKRKKPGRQEVRLESSEC